MNTEKLKELITNSDSNQLQKNIMIGFIDRANELESLRREDRKLIELIASEKYIDEVVISNEDVRIYKIKNNDKESWGYKYPYRSIVKDKNGIWRRSVTASPTLDLAYLVYLENKYLGLNSKFHEFAIKMLDIKIEE